MRDKVLRGEIVVFILAVFIALICLPAAAQNAGAAIYSPITKVDLGTDKVELEVGESYTFSVAYEPEVPYVKELTWFLANRDIAVIHQGLFTITAKQPGQSMLMVYSIDKNAYDSCEIIVKGDPVPGTEKTRSGKKLMTASASDLAKIRAIDINKYMEAVRNTSFTEEQFAEAMQETFRALAHVKPGTESVQSERAAVLGMLNSEALTHLNLVTLQGTLEQILNYVRNNKDLEFLEGETVEFITDPIDEEFSTESVQKAFNLGGSSAELTQIHVVHDLGIYGQGQTIAVIDTGLNSSHEQFAGRVIKERCFSTTTYGGLPRYLSACKDGAWVSDSAMPYGTNSGYSADFNHGSHVTGIAAGRDGVAPQANIVAIQAFSIYAYECGSGSTCTDSLILSSDKQRAYNWLLSLIEDGIDIASLNMSFGSYGGSNYCDSNDSQTKALQKLTEKGVVPAAATGNNGYKAAIHTPGCLSTTIAVGALSNYTTPKIAAFSNHGEIVDILAPGVAIYSVCLNRYCKMAGTSMATPFVAGALALLKQIYPDQTFEEYKAFYPAISTRTAQTREDNYSFSYTKPILDFTDFGKHIIGTLSIETNNIRGYTNGITVKFLPVTNATGYEAAIFDYKTGKQVSSGVRITTEWDDTHTYQILRFVGSALKNGSPYKIIVRPYRRIGEYNYYGKAKTVYGAPNPRITAITAAPGDGRVTLRTVQHATADGFRYNIYEEGNATRFKYIDVTAGGNLIKTVTGLTNGKEYYVTAIPYTVIEGTKCWGASMYRIYFVPLSAPENVKVSWPDSSQAKITVKADSAADGVKVLYRTAGGTLKNGCEAKGSSCTVSGLNKKTAYEFYVLKYKTVNNKKHYGPGTLYNWKTDNSGLAAPTKPLIAKRGAKLLTFTITKSSKAKGISVLYREGEGKFKQACEAASATCQMDGFDWSKDYTFYIMQYKVVSGKRVYSPGITVTNWLTPKTPDGDPETMPANLIYTADAEPADLYDVLDEYYTEADALFDEAIRVLSSEMDTAQKTADKTENDADVLSDDPDAEVFAEVTDKADLDTVRFTAIDIPDPVEADPAAVISSAETAFKPSGIFLGYDIRTGEFVGAESAGTDSAVPSNAYPGVQFYTVSGNGLRPETPIPSFGN